jgi:membrane protease YdiL (CAAX protease family)
MSFLSKAEGNWLRQNLIEPWGRFMIVLTPILCFFNYASYLATLYPERQDIYLHPNDPFLRLLWYDSSILGIFLAYLHFRGWKIKDLNINVNWSNTRLGFSLFIIVFLADTEAVFGLRKLFGEFQHGGLSLHPPNPHEHPFLGLVLISIILNAFCEQVIFVSYAFSQIAAKTTPYLAIAVMVGLRLTYHTWQGPINLCGTAIAFILYGISYWLKQDLWVLIFAQTLFDLFIAFH